MGTFYDISKGVKQPIIKSIPLEGKTTAHINLHSGIVAMEVNNFTTSTLPFIKLNHIFRYDSAKRYYGNGWHTNLHRQLKISNEDTLTTTKYVYTDEFGDDYAFDEKYYFLDDSNQPVYIDKNDVSVDIEGSLKYGNNQVYIRQSARGFVLIPKLDDFKYAELLEDREQVEIQLEEYIAQTRISLYNYVRINISERTLVKKLTSLTKSAYNTFISDFDKEKELLITEENYDVLKLLSEIEIEKFIEMAKMHQDVICQTFKNFFAKSDELSLLKLQKAVCFLKDENGQISGFNSYGDLVFISDSFGNYVKIKYERPALIKEVFGKNGAIFKFEYKNLLLRSITDNRGRKVKFIYKGKNLSSIMYTDKKVLNFTYGNQITEIATNEGLHLMFLYNKLKISQLGVLTDVNEISLKVIRKKDIFDFNVLKNYIFSYEPNSIKIGYKNYEYEAYVFNDDNSVAVYETFDVNAIKTTTEYTYSKTADGTRVKKTTRKDSEADDIEYSQYDKLDRLITRDSGWKNLSLTVKMKTVTDFAYDNNGYLLEQKTIRSYSENNIVSSVVGFIRYNYNTQGLLVLTETFTEGEESTSGIKYEEKVYNDKGNLLQSVKWNSLDSSSKFYDETVYDESGRVIGKKDETGKIYVEFSYSGNCKEASKTKFCNGSIFALVKDPLNSTLTSVTQSTEDGEANTNNIIYNCGLPVRLTNGNTAINYCYDFEGNLKHYNVNSHIPYSAEHKETENVITDTYKYNENDLTVTKIKTVNLSDVEDYKTNQKTLVNGEKIYEVTTDKKLRQQLIIDGEKTKTFSNNPNYYNQVSPIITKVGDDMILFEGYLYDKYGVVSEKRISGPVEQHYRYEYKNDAAHSLDFVFVSEFKFKPLIDVNGRNIGKEVYLGQNRQKIFGEYLVYRKVGDHATNMPATIWFANGKQLTENIKYKYDDLGNISEIYENGYLKAKYTYDALNRLIREDNKTLDKTVTLIYDSNGNIVKKSEYKYSLKSNIELSELACKNYDYIYEGSDLKSFNGENFSYNFVGNPTEYRGKEASWLYTKYLIGYNGVTFGYNGAGQRVSKGNITFTYDSEGNLVHQSDGLEYLYDANGLAAFIYNENKYFYRKDAQGNIIAILDNLGNVVVKYEYDAWGNHVVTDKDGNPVTSGIGVLNPFRYRSYYYDTETELYYLQTRYYDPELGRFISQDSIEYADPETINGLNLYAYCGNNPVMNIDPTGTAWWLWREISDFFSNIYDGIITPIKNVFNKTNDALDNYIIKPIENWTNRTVNPVLFKTFLNTWKWLNGDEWYQYFTKNLILASVSTLIGVAFGPLGAKAGLIMGIVSSFCVGQWWDYSNSVWDWFIVGGIFSK